MPTYRAALFDADGVLIRPPELFSQRYAREHGLSPDHLKPFFNEDFLKTSLGQADLKELIVHRHDLWRWDGDPQELLDAWFAAENYPDPSLLELIEQYRKAGLHVSVATIQEKYRAAYLRDVMFPNQFDHIFTSSGLGFHKSDPRFFVKVLGALAKSMPGIRPSEVVYFDDHQEGLDTAAGLGIATYLYRDVEQVRSVLG